MESRHGTLVANTVTTVTFSANYSVVEFINVDGVSTIYFNIDTDTAPTVQGNDTYVLPATICSRTVGSDGKEATVVKLISSGTPKYSVVAY
jgi:hypothetical protein